MKPPPPRVDRDFDAASAALARELLAEFMAPPPRQTNTQWAEANRYLGASESSEPGPYRVSRTPYAREPQDCMSPRSPVEEVVLIWASQTGKTTVLLNCIGSSIANNPGPLMIVWPTNTVAKRNSRQRIAPLLNGSPQLARLVAHNRSRDKANTTLLKEFEGGILVIAGANSAADLRSTPVRDLYLDEVDNFPLDVDGEGDPSKLAEARQTTFTRRKRLRTSTPTTKDFSRIEGAFKATDRCYFHVPCPHCGSFQRLELGADTPHGLKWDKDPAGAPIPTSVRYVCAVHGCEIREHLKTAMLAGGVWIGEQPGAQAGKVRGFHLNGLYSPIGWLSWRTIAAEWFEAKQAEARGDLTLMRVFTNTRLAETFEEAGNRVAMGDLQRRARDIPIGLVQWGHYVRTLGVDVQGDRLEVFDWAFGRGMRAQLVDARVLYGDPALPESEPLSPWRQLTEYRTTAVFHDSGREVPLMACAIDTGGHYTHEAYVYCRNHRQEHVIAIKGASQAGKPILGKPSDVEVNQRGQKIQRGVKLWPIGTDTAKGVLYGRMRNEQVGSAGYLTLSKHLPTPVFEGLTSERLVTRYVKGRQRLEWVKTPGIANEPLDGTVYALAAAHYRGVDKWTEGQWLNHQAKIEPTHEPKVETPAEPAMAKATASGRISLAGMKRFDPPRPARPQR
jgi:phage terminase large subunit GpA-like protein